MIAKADFYGGGVGWTKTADFNLYGHIRVYWIRTEPPKPVIACFLPDATTLKNGHTIYVQNRVSQILEIRQAGAGIGIQIPSGSSAIVWLNDNSTSQGDWRTRIIPTKGP